MSNDFMFKRISDKANTPKTSTLHFFWQGKKINAESGDTIASALLASGIQSNRISPVSGNPRAPFCMMGSCFECMVEVNGQIIQACMEPVKEGMKVKKPPVEEQV